MTTITIKGAGLGDNVYVTNKAIIGVEIVWNVTRMMKDAEAGLFGAPESIPIALLPPLSDAAKANIDWEKVNGMVADYRKKLSASVIEKPVLQVLLELPTHLCRIPVDGNHRMMARKVAGKLHFESYVVPETMERFYRVTETRHD